MIMQVAFQTMAAASCAAEKSERFLGIIPKWYKYLPAENENGKCRVAIKLIENKTLNLQQLLPIGLSLIEMLLAVAGVVAVTFVIYGGFQYVTSQGEPENTKAALRTIINAFVGTTIAILASVVVAFIGNRLGV